MGVANRVLLRADCICVQLWVQHVCVLLLEPPATQNLPDKGLVVVVVGCLTSQQHCVSGTDLRRQRHKLPH